MNLIQLNIHPHTPIVCLLVHLHLHFTTTLNHFVQTKHLLLLHIQLLNIKCPHTSILCLLHLHFHFATIQMYFFLHTKHLFLPCFLPMMTSTTFTKLVPYLVLVFNIQFTLVPSHAAFLAPYCIPLSQFPLPLLQMSLHSAH